MMMKLYVRFQNLISRREGQGMTEYAVVIGLVALALITIVAAFGTEIGALFTRMAGQLHTM